MLYAIKGNRQVAIEEHEKKKFIGYGFEIATFENGILEYEEIEEVENKELEKLKEEVEELIKERTTLKGQLTRANNRIEELEKELKGEGK